MISQYLLFYRTSDVYKLWQKVGKPRNTEEYLFWPSIVNAYFNPPANEVRLRSSRILKPMLTRQ